LTTCCGRAPTRLAGMPAPWSNTRHGWVGRCKGFWCGDTHTIRSSCHCVECCQHFIGRMFLYTLSRVQDKNDSFCRLRTSKIFREAITVIAHLCSSLSRAKLDPTQAGPGTHIVAVCMQPLESGRVGSICDRLLCALNGIRSLMAAPHHALFRSVQKQRASDPLVPHR